MKKSTFFEWARLVTISIVFTSSFITATTFYVNPKTGSMANNGSKSAPWNRLDSVFANKKIGTIVTGGDTLLLFSGYHGKILQSGYCNSDYITIKAEKGETPQIASFELRSSCKWRLSGLTFSPTFAPAFSRTTMITLASTCTNCIVEDCYLFSIENSAAWDSVAWNTKSVNGIDLSGKNNQALRCHLKNVNFGISVSGDSCKVQNCKVENFAGDGMRGIGNYGLFENNYISGCYAVNANHDDGFQSWSNGDSGVGTDTVFGNILRGNTFICYLDSTQPFRGNLQGIGCFDGFYKDWIIENNVIFTDTWHGISLYGAINCRIVNNTVCDQNTLNPGPPWIGIFKHKNGTASSGNIIRNNLATAFTLGGSVNDHNKIVANTTSAYNSFFVDYSKFDFHLKSSSPAIDSGTTDKAPLIDLDGVLRHSNPDIGAYEYTQSKIINKRELQEAPTKELFLTKYKKNLSLVIPKATRILSVKIYTIAGRTVFSKTIGEPNQNTVANKMSASSEYQIGLHNLASGSYYAIVTIENFANKEMLVNGRFLVE